MRWWLSLCSLVWVVVACGELGADHGYKGVQRVVAGPYRVRSVFWLKEAPIVLATRRDEGKPGEIYLVNLTGGTPCRAGPAETYQAAVDERGFRLALTDSSDTLTFYDESCRPHLPRIPHADRLRVFVHRGQYRYLVQTLEGELLSVEPFGDTSETIGQDITFVTSSSLSGAQDEQLVLWIRSRSNALSLRTIVGESVGPTFKGVSEFVTSGGVVDDEGTSEVIATLEGDKVVVRRLRLDDGNIVHELLAEVAGACQPEILSLRSPQCEAGDCDAGARDAGSARLVPWVAMESPCGSGDLLLTSAEGAQQFTVAGAAADYRALPGATSASRSGPLLMFNRGEGADRATFMLDVQAGLEHGAEPMALPAVLDLSSLSSTQRSSELSAVTLEDSPRYGVLTPNGTFEPLLSGVRDQEQGIVLHTFEGESGELSYCSGNTCEPLASGVPLGRYHRYYTLSRLDESMTVFAYLRDYDAAKATGTLSVYAPALELRVDLDRDVSNFVDVESGPIRGVVYSIPTGARGGIWFAPR